MIIARYLSREIALAVAVVMISLLGLFAFFDLINELDDVGKNGYKYSMAVGFVLLNTPAKIYELMPVGVLIGSIYALSQFAGNSEFTAMRAAGLGRKEAVQSIGWLALMFVVLTFCVGEFLTPVLERYSKAVRSGNTATAVSALRSGAWIKDTQRAPDGTVLAQRFVNVKALDSDGTLRDLEVFEFDKNFSLRSILVAKSGAFVSAGQWRLLNVHVNYYDEQVGTAGELQAKARSESMSSQSWASELTPELFGVLAVDPEKMSALRLFQYTRHLKENQQRADRYEIAMWRKVIYPFVSVVMLVLALPFGYLNARSGGIGYKVAAGVLLGIAFHTLNSLFSHVGLLNTWPAWIAASVPSLMAVLLALFMLWWVDRA
jgi:lipopolysaccharide export system permease protein